MFPVACALAAATVAVAIVGDAVIGIFIVAFGALAAALFYGARAQAKRDEWLEALRDSEARKEAILESALDGVITMDHEGRVLEFNPAAERTFGYRREAVVGRELAGLIIPADLRERHRSALARFLETRESSLIDRRVELSGMRSDGSEFPVELAIGRIGSQWPPVFTGYVRDITARRRAEQERERLLELEQLARADADRARDELAAILRGVADGVTAQAPDGSLIFANARAVEAIGFDSEEELLNASPEEVMGRFHIYDESGQPFPLDRLPGRLALQGEPAAEAVLRQIDVRTCEERWSVVKATPILDERGDVVMAINVMEDITELKRSERAQRLLAEAGRELGSSLDTDALLRRIVRLAVPEMADWCGVHVLSSHGRSRLAAHAAREADQTATITELLERFPPDREAPVGLPHVLRTGEPGLYPEVTAELLDARAYSPEHRELNARVGLHSAVIAPVVARGRILGALSLYRLGAARPYGERDLAMAEELGRRIGIAVDNARLYGERTYIAKTLQQSLRPSRLPEIPGLAVAARFQAAGEAYEVGGDFYDLFEAGPGDWGVVIGDVCGKGPDAAAATAMARYTLRAAAMSETSTTHDADAPHKPHPSEGLRLLNDALLRQPLDLPFATVVHATVRPEREGVHITLASAGHPLPLLLRGDGAVAAIGVYGTLVGVVGDLHLDEVAVHLSPGDVVVFYTDGVTDARRGGGVLGEAGLREVLSGCPGLGAEEIAARIESAAVEPGGDELRDDIAILVLRALPRRDREAPPDVGEVTAVGISAQETTAGGR